MQKTDAPETSVSQGIAASKTKLDYSEYAQHYDQMCAIIPAYEENLQLLIDHSERFSLSDKPKICDLGAGTGNYICRLFEKYPDADFTHVDCDPVMNSLARKKYKSLGIEKVRVVEDYIQRVDFPQNHFDLLVCVNALNTAPPQRVMLSKACDWVKPDGVLFLIDFGRKQNVLDWASYIARNLVKQVGVAKTITTAFNTRKAITANHKGRGEQGAGRIWTHTTDELLSLFDGIDFEPEHIQTCYRDYCDLVIARKIADEREQVIVSAG